MHRFPKPSFPNVLLSYRLENFSYCLNKIFLYASFFSLSLSGLEQFISFLLKDIIYIFQNYYCGILLFLLQVKILSLFTFSSWATFYSPLVMTCIAFFWTLSHSLRCLKLHIQLWEIKWAMERRKITSCALQTVLLTFVLLVALWDSCSLEKLFPKQFSPVLCLSS